MWISGDGRTVFGVDQGKGVVVIASDGTVRRLDLRDVSGFLASEHG